MASCKICKVTFTERANLCGDDIIEYCYYTLFSHKTLAVASETFSSLLHDQQLQNSLDDYDVKIQVFDDPVVFGGSYSIGQIHPDRMA